MLARIYRPAKTAMQSGKAKSRDWRLEFEPASARTIDPLMGWTSSSDMNGQVRLSFESKDEAIAYAERHGIPFRLHEPQEAPGIRLFFAAHVCCLPRCRHDDGVKSRTPAGRLLHIAAAPCASGRHGRTRGRKLPAQSNFADFPPRRCLTRTCRLHVRRQPFLCRHQRPRARARRN